MVSNKLSSGGGDAGRTTGMPGRRSFLLMAGAAVGAGALSSCMRVAEGQAGAAGTVRVTRQARLTAAVNSPNWTALRDDLSTHQLLQPGNRTYPAAKVLFDPRFDGLEPAAIAYCRTPGDVSTCLAFARKYGVRIRARSGGHSYAGWSSVTGGLIVDVTQMNSFSVGSGNVQVGTGTHLIDLYNHLAAHGLAVPGGSCPTVGSAGLTLGGGVGVLDRAYGLTCDNLESVQIVTADGLIRECSAASNSDLFWACRGGGGGNFGVATSFTFRTHPLSRLVLFFLSWPWSQAFRVIAGWQAWAPSAPDALWSNLHLAASPGGTTPSVTVGGTYLGSVSGAASLLHKLYAAVRSSPSSHFLAEETFLNAMLVEAGCSGLNVNECHLPGQAPGGTLTRQPEIAKSDFFTRRLPASGVNTLLAGVEKLQRVHGAAGGAGGVAFDAFGGVINRVAPSATAFVHRNALFLAQYTTVWRTGAASGGVANQQAWLRSFYASMRPYASGQAYQNYVDPDLTNWSQAYYGANYPRLQQIKAKYDPHQLFDFPQAITPHA
ncbi:MAG TPA: FAD-binding oxidoreductase [Streptosporangiaceae bacterium]|nr:FAD-binding oxidoreductase [Streptosporangiaceae bacterium]